MKTSVVLFAGSYMPESFEKILGWAETVPYCSDITVFASSNAKEFDNKNVTFIKKEFWTVQSLLDEMVSVTAKNNTDLIVYSWADCPFISKILTKELFEQHTKYVAEYSFADGYPYGLTPEIIDAGTVGILAQLAKSKSGYDIKAVEKDSLFELLKTDINSFEIETLISPEDFRISRIELCTRTKRGRVLCENLEVLISEKAKVGEPTARCATNSKICTIDETSAIEKDEISALEISRLAVSHAETLHTLPSFYAIQISAGCTGKCVYCPYPSVFEKKYDCNPSALCDENANGNLMNGKNSNLANSKIAPFMSYEDFSKIVNKISDFSGEAVVSLSLWGEPTFNAELPKFIDEVLKYEGLSVLIETTCHGLTPEIIDEISKVVANRNNGSLTAQRKNGYPPIMWICGLDAWTNETYALIHGSDDLDKVRLVSSILKNTFGENVYNQMVRITENEQELEPFFRGYENRIIQKYDDVSKTLPDRKPADLSPVNRYPCNHIRRDMSILIDGSVPLCRQYMFSNIIGNAKTDSLEEIWNKSVPCMKAQLKGEYTDLCKECDEYYTCNF